MTTPDPVALAREVLDEYSRTDDWSKPRSRSGKELPPIKVLLARAVISLTVEVDAELEENTRLREQVARVEALADDLARYAEKLEADGEDGYADAARTDAHRIRTALNGDPA